MPLHTQFVYYLRRRVRRGPWRLAALAALATGISVVLSGCSATGPMHRAPRADGAVVILIPGWTLSAARRSPAWHSLIRESAFGVVALRTADRGSPTPSQRLNAIGITLGAGSRAAAPTHLASGSTQQVAFAIGRINSLLDHAVVTGRLGDEVRAAGGVVVSLGGARAGDDCEPGLLMAMDSSGNCRVAAPPISGVAAATWPFGMRDDTNAILRSVSDAQQSARLVLVTLGDIYRADQYASRCLPAQAAEQRTRAISEVNAEIDQINKQVRSALQPRALMVIGLPDIASSSDIANRLGVCALAAPTRHAARIYSASTHRLGILVATDLEPALADLLRIDNSSPLRLADDQPGDLTISPSSYWAQTIAESRSADLLGGWPILQALMLLAVVLLPSDSRLARCALLLVLSIPLVCLLLPQVAAGSPAVCATLFVAATAALAITLMLAAERFGLGSAVTALLAVTVSAIFLDLVTGAHLMQSAWMSYTITEGARFYGIGNEMMGAAVGAACALIAMAHPAPENAHAGPLPLAMEYAGACALAAAMALPRFGAKAGAAPSVCIALFAALGSRSSVRAAWRGAATGALAGALLLAAAVKMDSAAGTIGRTHIARAASRHLRTIIRIVERKLMMEGWLLTHSVWTLELLTAALAITVLGRRVSRTGWPLPMSLIIASAAALLLNDSGVSASALILAFGVAPAFLAGQGITAAGSLAKRPIAPDPIAAFGHAADSPSSRPPEQPGCDSS